ncbi:MAG TPA: hypothetical protein VGM54_04245 [Chthoniobacter sp.]|jgi:hypothetical protein
MPSSTEAEENLRVIRSLMEKATIYRAVSAPTALAGGVAALVVSTLWMQNLFLKWLESFKWLEPSVDSFRIRWFLALIFTLAVNSLLILREARRRGDPLISPGMRAAMVALLPPMLCGAVFFLIMGPVHTPVYLAVFYGLALLATGHFAPRSIVWLGWSFLIAGLVGYLSIVDGSFSAMCTPDRFMVLTFGGFHFVYAACTWPRKIPVVVPGATRSDV